MYPSLEKIKPILSKSYISEADSKAAEEAGKDSAGYIGYLLREQLLTKTLLGQALAEVYKLPFADLGVHPPSKEVLAKLPEELARESRLIMLDSSEEQMAVATDQPDKIDSAKLKAALPKHKVKIYYTLPEFVDANLLQYEKPLATRFSTIIQEGERVAPEIVDEIIKDALTFKASDIHLEPQGDKIVVVRFRVDGNLRSAGEIPKQYFENILNRIKVESGMRIDEHMSAQDGAIVRREEHLSVDLRVSLIPTVQGEKVVMRVLNSYVQNYTLADIGLNERHREMLDGAAAKPFGMILTTGPTGSGKTTTLYAILQLLNKPNVNITTIEDPVEYKLIGINQIQVREQSNLTFAKGLRSIVRQDPDIILVGEIRDQETAEISVNAALTGHLLLSTFHANDAATSIPRLIDMGVEPFLLASTLEVIMAQRLVRKICHHCRYSLKFADIPPTGKGPQIDLTKFFNKADTVYGGKGCQYCSNSGYMGRSAIFEFIEITPEMQELILKSPSDIEVKGLAQKQGFVSMFEDGVAKVKAGTTTISEILRVAEPPEA